MLEAKTMNLLKNLRELGIRGPGSESSESESPESEGSGSGVRDQGVRDQEVRDQRDQRDQGVRDQLTLQRGLRVKLGITGSARNLLRNVTTLLYTVVYIADSRA